MEQQGKVVELGAHLIVDSAMQESLPPGMLPGMPQMVEGPQGEIILIEPNRNLVVKTYSSVTLETSGAITIKR